MDVCDADASLPLMLENVFICAGHTGHTGSLRSRDIFLIRHNALAVERNFTLAQSPSTSFHSLQGGAAGKEISLWSNTRYWFWCWSWSAWAHWWGTPLHPSARPLPARCCASSEGPAWPSFFGTTLHLSSGPYTGCSLAGSTWVHLAASHQLDKMLHYSASHAWPPGSWGWGDLFCTHWGRKRMFATLCRTCWSFLVDCRYAPHHHKVATLSL